MCWAPPSPLVVFWFPPASAASPAAVWRCVPPSSAAWPHYWSKRQGLWTEKKKAKLTSLLGLSKSTPTRVARWCLRRYLSTRTHIGLWLQSWDQAAESLKAKLDVRPSLLLSRYVCCPPALSDTHQQRRTDNVLFVSEKIFKCNWHFGQVQTSKAAINYSHYYHYHYYYHYCCCSAHKPDFVHSWPRVCCRCCW